MSRRSFAWMTRPQATGVRPIRRVDPPGPGRHRLAWSLLAVSLVGGCEVAEPPAAPRGPRLYPARGTVTVDGKPLARAIVVFLPAFSSGTHSVAETKADGTYEMAYMGRPGVGRGDYRVVVSYLVGENGKVADLAAHGAVYKPPELNHGKELVPPRYSDFSRTELRAIVPPVGTSTTFDFALKGPLLEPPARAPRDEPAPAKQAAQPPGRPHAEPGR